MPVFTFEKISPPVRRGPIAPVVKKQRGVIIQILDRFVEARAKRTLRGERASSAASRSRRTNLTVIPGRVADGNPESWDSPMRNCASEVWSFGPSRK